MSSELPFKAVYPATESVIDWMSHNLEAAEEGVVRHWMSLRRVAQFVEIAESTKRPIDRFRAKSAIRNANDDSATRVEYEEVRDRCSTYVPSFEGEWVAFTDNSMDLIFQEGDEHHEIEDVLYFCPMDVNWVIVWLPGKEVLVVYRSPHVEGRRIAEEGEEFLLSEGLRRGDQPSFTLGSEAEALLRQDLHGQVEGPISEALRLQTPPARRAESVSITELIYP